MEQIAELGQNLASGAIVVAVALALLKWLLKKQIDDLFGSMEKMQDGIRATKTELAEIIKENDKKTDERITKLEEYTRTEIGDIKKEVNSIKGDFATTFVLREDFFRFGNGVEDKLDNVNGKMDKLMFLVSGRKGESGT